MGPRASKINFSKLNLHGLNPKNMIPMSIRVRNDTFDRFLKIFCNKIITPLPKDPKLRGSGRNKMH